MDKILNLQTKNKAGELVDTGRIELKNAVDKHIDLYFYGDIVSDSWRVGSDEDKCPKDVADILRDLNDYETVDIYINSGGGSVFGGIAIYNMLKRYNGRKITHIDGLAASIASVIALAGDEIRMPRYSQLMIHKPHIFLFFRTCDSDSFRKMADALDASQRSILQIYMENAQKGVTEEEMNDLINQETWFTGEEALEYFNIVLEEDEEEPVASISSNFYDFYKNKPKNLVNNKIKNKKNTISVQNKQQENEEKENEEQIELNKLKEKLAFKNKNIASFLYCQKNNN